MTRLRIKLSGLVQGVGFRPFTVRVAKSYNLTGWVKNTGDGVLLEWQGEAPHAACETLHQQLPLGARIEKTETESVAKVVSEQSFVILDSWPEGRAMAIGNDVGVCGRCLQEIFDPQSRFFGHALHGCTECGPRYTAVTGLPFDRANSSMAVFSRCAECERDYHDPDSRFFHAQMLSCSRCGPQYDKPPEDIALGVRRGHVLALKGVGGYHLVCDARNQEAVIKLRFCKKRPDQPLAIMVPHVGAVRALFDINDAELAALTSAAYPIVLLRLRENVRIPGVSPELDTVGVMLPYAPIHYLLFWHLAGCPSLTQPWDQLESDDILVMTSANAHGVPMLCDHEAACVALRDVADEIISHNREIMRRCDDSVLRVVNQAPLFVRRARGYVPQVLTLPGWVEPVLATGVHAKNTLCLAAGKQAFVSQHIGDLTSVEAIDFAEQVRDELIAFTGIEPQYVLHDVHPNFWGSRFAVCSGLMPLATQHHVAHVAAVAGEHNLQGPFWGIALDGYGMGPQGERWGGELLYYNGTHFQRVSGLVPLRLPGGERAAKEPLRMALAAINSVHEIGNQCEQFSAKHHLENLFPLLESEMLSPYSSSCGRWFDAAAGLLGFTKTQTYEGQAALYLESNCSELGGDAFYAVNERGELDLRPVVDVLSRSTFAEGSRCFHESLIQGLVAWLLWHRRDFAEPVVLGGGCFVNRWLSGALPQRLREHGVSVYLPHQLPPNDGAISYGQVCAWHYGATLCV